MLFVIKNNRLLFKIDSDNPDIYTGEFDLILVGQETDFYDESKNVLVSTVNAPSEQHEWIDNQWLVREKIDVNPVFVPLIAFSNFYQDIKNSDIWQVIKTHGSKSLKLNLAVTMLINSVTTTFSTSDFKESFTDFVTGFYEYNLSIENQDVVVDLKLIDFVQNLLDKHRIPVTLEVITYVES